MERRPDEHEQVVELLKQAQLPAEQATSEQQEKALRWLVRTARPEVKAPDALRARVQSLAEGHRENPPSRLRRIGSRLSGRRRLLLSFVPLAAACLLLVLSFTGRARAQLLARTLHAMSLVRTAHGVGTRVEYRNSGETRHTVQVEWWYEAPSSFRVDQRPTAAGDRIPASRLFVRDGEGVAQFPSPAGSWQRTIVGSQALTQSLWTVDFFSHQGFLRRAVEEKSARVTQDEPGDGSGTVQIIKVQMVEPRPAGRYRRSWILIVDPASDLILRSESRVEREVQRDVWETRSVETLHRIEYGIPLNDRLFDPAAAAEADPSTAS